MRKVEETTINQRLKFLIEKLNLTAKAFSERIGESPTTTHNYVSARNAEPRATYLAKTVSHFADLDARWLLTGQGEPFLSNAPTEASNTSSHNKKISRSFLTGNVGRDVIQNQGALGNEQALKREIELLQGQLADKERTIQILLSK
jgi:transcriptional regulator with XRE-family HTH domain